MVQLSTEQRVFVVTTYTLTQSVTEVQNAFTISWSISWLDDREVINIPPFMYNSIKFPKV